MARSFIVFVLFNPMFRVCVCEDGVGIYWTDGVRGGEVS